jgi:hypothetical protein
VDINQRNEPSFLPSWSSAIAPFAPARASIYLRCWDDST